MKTESCPTCRAHGRVLGLALAACGGGNIQNAPAPSGGGGQAANCGKLNMAINPWVGYEASAHVVGYVAKSKLGCESSTRTSRRRSPGRAWATARSTW